MKEGSEGEPVLHVLLCMFKCVCAQFNGLFPRTLAGVVEGARTEKPAHKEEHRYSQIATKQHCQ